MNSWRKSAIWAFAIVVVSMGAAYILDALGFQMAARWMLVPVYPVLIFMMYLAGGLHSAAGDTGLMIITAIVSWGMWFGLIHTWRIWKKRLREGVASFLFRPRGPQEYALPMHS
jgi:hypothetical protein